MAFNFQDVIRDVHDPSTHTLKTSGGSANSTIFVGTPTLFAVVNTGASGDPGTYIGLTTTTLGVGTRFIGLVTVVQSSSARTITGNLTLSDSKGYIGLTTTTIANSVTVGNAMVTVTLGTALDSTNDSVAIGGSLPAGVNGIGFATVNVTNLARTITGNLTLSYGSDVSVYSGVISASGNSTLFVAPASNRFFIKNLHVSSLGRSEIEFKSGATTLIPLTSLSTTSGFASHYGETGWPARAQTDALVASLNGGATVSIGVTYRIAP